MKTSVALLILVISTSINAYNLSGFSWQENNIPFYIGVNSNEDGTSAADYEAALNDAITAWNNSSNFKYSTVSTYKNPCISDNYNSVRFKYDICGVAFGATTLAVAHSRFTRNYLGNNTTTESDIIFNSTQLWGIHNSNSNSPTDFKRVALHEVGHTLGLAHSNTRSSIIYYSYQNNIKTLQTDDINGIRAIYGANNISISAPSSVSASDGSYSSFVRISWGSVSDALSYRIYRATSSSGSYSKIATDSSSPYYDTSATSGVTYYYKLKACTGSNGSGICSSYSSYNSGYRGTISSLSIPNSVDNTNLFFFNSGDANWYGQTTTAYSGGDAAQSGSISDNQRSCMQTIISGGGNLSFYWKVSSEEDYDHLRFYVNYIEQDEISGSTSWAQKSYSISSGFKILEWCYVKDGSDDIGSDAGWVDKIVYTQDSSSSKEGDIYLTNARLNTTSVEAGGRVIANVNQCYSGNIRNRDLINPEVGFYLSNNTSWGSSDVYLDYDDSSIGADDLCDSEYESLTIPSNTTAGRWYILFVADRNNEIAETNENNNVKYVALTITSTTPNTPNAPTVSVQSSSQINLSWSGVSGANYYRLYSGRSGGRYSQIYAGSSRSYSDTGLFANTTYYYILKACSTSSISTCSTSSTYRIATTQRNIISVPIPDSVDNSNLSFTSSGDANWYGQITTAYSGGDAAQSGDITSNQLSCMQTTVSGGNLSFYWKVSSEEDYDYLRFYVNNIEQSKISGSTNWAQKSYTLGSSNKILKWCYTKDLFLYSGSDAGWVDKIVWTSIPTQPTAPTASVQSSSQINLSWSSVSGANYYRLYSSRSGGRYSQIYTGSSRSYSDTGLFANTTYYYILKACSTSSISTCSTSSTYRIATTQQAIPNIPPVTTASVQSTSQINLSWSSVSGASYYRLYSSRSGGRYSQIYTGSSRSYSNTGLSANTAYYYKLKACANSSIGTCSDYSPIRTAITTPDIPPPPTVSIQNSNQINLSWDNSGANYYHLYRATWPSSSYSQIYTGSNTSYNDNRAYTDNTIYYYRLKACNDNSDCSDNSRSRRTYQSLTTSPQSTSQIDLSWSSISGANHYRLYNNSQIYAGNNNSFSDTGLSAGTAYYYRIKVCASSDINTCIDYSPYYHYSVTNVVPVANIVITNPTVSATASTGEFSFNITETSGRNAIFTNTTTLVITANLTGVTAIGTIPTIPNFETTVTGTTITFTQTAEINSDTTTLITIPITTTANTKMGISIATNTLEYINTPKLSTEVAVTTANTANIQTRYSFTPKITTLTSDKNALSQLSAPHLKSAKPIGEDKIKLKYAATPVATIYNIYYTTQPPANPNIFDHQQAQSTQTIYITPPLPQQSHYFIITSETENGEESPPSNQLKATPKKHLSLNPKSN